MKKGTLKKRNLSCRFVAVILILTLSMILSVQASFANTTDTADEIIPTIPSEEEIVLILSNSVSVACTNNDAHVQQDFDLEAGTFSISDLEGNAEVGYSLTISVNANSYIEKYSLITEKEHKLTYPSTDTMEIYLTWFDGEWCITGCSVFWVTCEDTALPEEPGDSNKVPDIPNSETPDDSSPILDEDGNSTLLNPYYEEVTSNTDVSKSDIPNTGDSSHLDLLFVILGISTVTILILIKRYKSFKK